jgi:hypothetical protein
LGAKLETGQLRDTTKKLHEAGSGGFIGMKYEGKRLGGDVLILVGQTFLNDVTEYGVHFWLTLIVRFDLFRQTEVFIFRKGVKFQ